MLYAYEIPGLNPLQALRNPAIGRLLLAGVSHACEGFAGGALLCSEPGDHERTAFGEPSRTTEGWVFYPPAEVPPLAFLSGPMANAPGNHQVPLRCGGILIVRPAYLEPRLVFSGGNAADHATHYGRIARALRDKIRNGQAPDLVSAEVLAVVQAAIMAVYPCTPEALDAVNLAHPFLTDDDLQPILNAIFVPPKAQPAAAG